MSIAVLFSGQGAQKVGMGASLVEASPLARALYEEADDTLGWSLSQASFEGPEERLTETAVCQPALFVHGYVLFRLLQERGEITELKAALGLSLGELTALTAAGALSFADGLKVVAERGRLMQMACEATKGGMASLIGGPIDAVQALAEEFDVDIANLNCPSQIVISGDFDRIQTAVAKAKEGKLFKMVVPLKVAGAYHSRLMEPARTAFAEYLKDVPFQTPTKTVFTNVTGQTVTDVDSIRAALAAQVVSSVRWEDCMRAAASLVDSFVECGPGKVLAGLAKRTDRSWKVRSVAEWSDLDIA